MSSYDFLKSKLDMSKVILLLVSVIGFTSSCVIYLRKIDENQVKTNETLATIVSRQDKSDAKSEANQDLLLKKMGLNRWTFQMEKDKTEEQSKTQEFLTVTDIMRIHDRYKNP